MKSLKLNAVVIKRRNFLEKDRILTLFSQENGKTEALAKGARRPGNRLSPNSDLGTIARFHLHQTKTIDIITEIDPIYHPFGARGEYEKTQTISYALKIIDRLYESDEPHPATFYALCRLIESVSTDSRQLIFLKFLLDVLKDLGALPELKNCTYCQNKIGEAEEFVFDLKGGLSHQDCSKEKCLSVSHDEVKLLRLLDEVSIDKAQEFKVSHEVYEKAYRLTMEHFNFEFGKLLDDKVM